MTDIPIIRDYDSLNTLSEMSEQYKAAYETLVEWKNDETKLNQENMNKLRNAITMLQNADTIVNNKTIKMLWQLLDELVGQRIKNAGYSEPVNVNDYMTDSNVNDGNTLNLTKPGAPEIFNDYEDNKAVSPYSHAEGLSTDAGNVPAVNAREIEQFLKGASDVDTSMLKGIAAHAEGAHTCAQNDFSHAEGLASKAIGVGSHAEGCANFNNSNIKVKKIEGNRLTVDSTDYSDLIDKFPKGALIRVKDCRAIVDDVEKVIEQLPETGTEESPEGAETPIEGENAPTTKETYKLVLRYPISAVIDTDAETGEPKEEICVYVVDIDSGSVAKGMASHAEGTGNIASGENQHVQGRYNEEDPNSTYAHIVGNGSGPELRNRSNAHTLDWNGNAWYAGNVGVPEDKDFVGRVNFDGVVEEFKLIARLLQEIQDRKHADEELKGKDTDSIDLITIHGARNYAKTYTDAEITKLLNDWVNDGDQDTIINKVKEIITWFANHEEGSDTLKDILDTISSLENNKLDKTDAVGKHYIDPNGIIHGEVFNDYDANVADGDYSHAEGEETNASGEASHAEGYNTSATSFASHTEGYETQATNNRAHAEGYRTVASGVSSHAEGEDTKACGGASHSEGASCEAWGIASHAEGSGTIATADYQHVQGHHNVIDEDKEYLHIVGNGESSDTRSNAHTIDKYGNAWFGGNVYVGGTGQHDNNAKRIPMIYTGNGDPDPSIGEDGDIYIAKETNRPSTGQNGITEDTIWDEIVMRDQNNGQKYKLYISGGRLLIENIEEVS